MLTQEDLHAIGKLIDKKLDSKLEIKFNLLEKKIEDKFERSLKPLRTDIRKMRRDMNSIIHVFDNEVIDLKDRVERIESHLHL